MEEAQEPLGPVGIPEGSGVQPQHTALRSGLAAVTTAFQLLLFKGNLLLGSTPNCLHVLVQFLPVSFYPPVLFPPLLTWLSCSHFHYLH